uniref:Ig-like domain-containing protein n=1 Tax=Kryptolebias marmoratus TaxID=37003 RepID=A0A3Q3AFB5_KRYMA
MVNGLHLYSALSTLIQTAEIPQQIPLTVVEVGGNATFHCPVSEKDGKFFHWYKQPLGYMIQTVASGSFQEQKLRGQFNNGRFKITERTAEYILTIRNVTKEDEGTYFCQNGTAYSQSFAAGIYLVVNDHIGQSFISVSQTPTTISVQEGDTVTLSCSLLSKTKENTDGCSGENSVYWFRVGLGESHPNIVYAQECSDAQERRSCGYRLSKTMKTPSDAGTYYCAVVTCGRILLGQGTKVDTENWDPVVISLGVLLGLYVNLVELLVIFCMNK